MAMVATIASNNSQYLSGWFNTHCVTIRVRTLAIFLPQPTFVG